MLRQFSYFDCQQKGAFQNLKNNNILGVFYLSRSLSFQEIIGIMEVSLSYCLFQYLFERNMNRHILMMSLE